jgi:hypothetical protein
MGFGKGATSSRAVSGTLIVGLQPLRPLYSFPETALEADSPRGSVLSGKRIDALLRFGEIWRDLERLSVGCSCLIGTAALRESAAQG